MRVHAACYERWSQGEWCCDDCSAELDAYYAPPEEEAADEEPPELPYPAVTTTEDTPGNLPTPII